MLERDIIKRFCRESIENISALFNEEFRIYALELPIVTTDGTKFADVVLEVLDESAFRDKRLYVLEFKKDRIDYHSVVSQVKRYCHFIVKQLYKNTPAVPVIVAPEFSKWEIRTALKAGVICVQLDATGNMRILSSTSSAT